MNTRKLILTGAIGAVGLLGIASIGVAFAEGGDGTGPFGGMMGGHHAGVTTQQMPAQMQEAMAKALGITVDELNAQLAVGKTVADIAQAKGLDLATVMQTVMTTIHGDAATGCDPDMMDGQGTGPGMMGAGAGRGATGGYGPGMMGGRGSNIN